MKPQAATATPREARWTFVARKAPGRGGLSMRKVAVSELEHVRKGNGRAGVRTRLDSPELAMHLTQAFQSAVKRVKRAKGRDAVRT
jgi:hypothetical protein